MNRIAWSIALAGAVLLAGCETIPGYGVGNPGAYPGSGYPGDPYPGTPYPGNGYPGSGYPGQPIPGYGAAVRCESKDNRTQYCAMDTRGGVRLSRQLSDSACIQGRSWGFDGRGVWVSQGCRAEFVGGSGGGYPGGYPGSGYPPGGATLRCESNDNRMQRCPADTRGGVRIGRQLSDSACIRGRTWGYDRQGIWVNQGCRAEFIVGAFGPGGTTGSGLVRCESVDNKPRRCNAPVRSGVQLSRQLSDTRCELNRNWGWDRTGIWVSGGCRGEFRVY